jgi:hypothetical protein
LINAGQGVGGATPEPSAAGADVALVFLLFAAALYSILRRALPTRTAAVFSFGGGVVLTIGLTVFAGISIALGDSVGRVSALAAQAINLVGLVDIFAVTIGD